eukprot:CAMPEP_0185022318 /NCGR_PEP_ID=MMETSP1103-20130426/5024_1 /TAXON_ID=36769 /ORGANISM="Paraphysomonas bandaiensis, Strain Caron Lab Isolate" /LENGTH=849 /DNA_ID=CAMNT_0027554327 /DNA_START=501 /DNA_END=3050 /DNA_ORIENTATION=-
MIYASALGIDVISGKTNVSSSLFIAELGGVLKTLQDIQTTGGVIEVRSMWRSLVEELLILDEDVSVIRELTSAVVSAESSEQWEESFSNLVVAWGELFGVGDTSTTSETRHLRNRYRLLEGMHILSNKYFLEACSGRIEFNLCLSGEARRQIGNLIASYGQFIHDSVPLGKHLALALTALGSSIQNSFAPRKQCLSRDHFKPTSPPLHRFLSFSTIHVMIYISTADHGEVVNHLQHWRVSCPSCAIVTLYSITTLDGIESGREGEHMREVVLHLEDYLRHVAVEPDIVVVLLGLESVKAFRTPGGTGIIPEVVIGEDNNFRLHSPLLVAASCAIPPSVDSECLCTLDVRALAATVPEMWNVLEAISINPLSSYTSDAIRHALEEYIILNSDSVLVDGDGTFFDFNIMTQDSAVDVSSRYEDYTVQLKQVEEDIVGILNSSDTWMSLFKDRILDGFLKGNYMVALYLAQFVFLFAPQSVLYSTINIIHQIPRTLKFVSDLTSVEEKLAAIEYLESASVSILDINPYDLECCGDDLVLAKEHIIHMRLSMLRAIEGFYLDLGNWNTVVDRYKDRMPPPTYDEVRMARKEWYSQRQSLTRLPNGEIKTHYFTYANEHRDGLVSLVRSALFSDIEVQIVGMGEKWSGFWQKFRGYWNAIDDSDIIDDDVIVLIDAYDVLLFPQAKRIGEVLEVSQTAIVSCVENGVHIDKASAWYYSRGGTTENIFNAKFINSGCIAGRAGQIKQFLLDALDRMSFDPDDQTATMSYSFRNPHVLSLDMEQNMFLCAYKESPKSFTVRAESCNLEFNGNSTSAGIVHMNGATYKIMSERLLSALELCMSGQGRENYQTMEAAQ